MAEELGVDGAVGDGAAVHGDVDAMFAGALVMDDLGDELLADAAFSGYEHREVGGRHLACHFDCSVQLRIVSYDAETLFYLR